MEQQNSFFKWILFSVILLLGIFVFMTGIVFFIPKWQSDHFYSKMNTQEKFDSSAVAVNDLKKLKKDIVMLNAKIVRFNRGNAFLIVNTSDNSFRLFKNNEIIRVGLCSTGSLIELEVDSTKSWTFETPKGALSVKSKITNPIWIKPDWAFIEEGLAVPPATDPSRYERGVLGDYALSLGNGYLIHGTLYQRLLGQPVTHGCIRMADEDLEIVYRNLELGSKVFIY